MSYLLAIFPPDKDISPIVDCVKQFGFQFDVKSTYEGLAPFAKNYAVQQELNVKIKRDHHALNAHMPFSNKAIVKGEVEDEEIEEEVVADLPSDRENNALLQWAYLLMGGNGGNADGELDDPTHDGTEEGGADDVDMDETVKKYNFENHSCLVDGCSEKLPSREDLLKHMRTHPKPLRCGICKCSYPKSSSLLRHYGRHGGNTFECDTCKLTFTYAHLLKQHQRVHTREKPYSCHVCDKNFAHLSVLGVHMRKHTGERPFECDVCGHKAADPSNMAKHRRIHSGKKSYACDTCGFTTTRSDHLSSHKKRFAH